MYEAGYAVVESAKIDLDLGGFSGLPVRCCGDGKEYRFILRDKDYETNGIQYESAVRVSPLTPSVVLRKHSRAYDLTVECITSG